MTARTRILNVILSSDTPLVAGDIAERARAKPDHTRHVLADLYKEMLVGRDSGRYKGSWAYYYRPREEGEVAKVVSAEDGAVEIAIAQNREKWRTGELFTREQVREHRERYGRLKSHGVIRT